MNKFYKNWSLLTISNLIYQGLVFLSFVRIARLLKPELYGTFTIIITVTQIAQLFSSLGLQKIVIREIARDNKKTFIIAKLTIIPTLIATFFSLVILVFYLIKFEQLSDSFTLVFSAILFAALTLWNYTEPLAFGKQQMKLSSYLNVVSAVLLISAIYLIPGKYFDIRSALTIYVSIFVLRASAYLLIEWKAGYFSKIDGIQDSGITIKYLLDRSIAYYGTSLLAIPTVQLPILFLAQFSGEKEVGYYGIVNKLSMPLSLVANNLFTAVYPVLAKYFVDNKDEFIERTTKLFTLVAIFGIIFSLFLGIFSKEIVDIVLGEKYEPAVRTFAVQVWATLNLVLMSFIGTIFLATDKEKLMVKLSVFNSVVIGISCYFGAFYGALGLSISSWISLLVGLVFHWVFMIKATSIKFDIYLKLSYLFYFILSSVISVLVSDYSLILKMGIYILLTILLIASYKKYIKAEFLTFYYGIKNYVGLILSRT